jgi:3-hydroxyisobutyrate dehydrogenase
MSASVGFIGLGHMGRPMSGHVATANNGALVFDLRPPEGECLADWTVVDAIEEVTATEVIFLSLPNVTAVEEVVNAIGGASGRRTRIVIDTSTVGPPGARRVADRLLEYGIEYVDAPVAGGVRGARAGTLTVMYSCRPAVREEADALLDAFSSHRFYVGEEPGLGQVAKLANNYLSGTAMAITSEAMAFATNLGIDPALMIDILNQSSGRNSATLDKWPNQVLTGAYDAGFAAALLLKDLRLFQATARDENVAWPIGESVVELWQKFDDAFPGSDVTEMYPYLREATTKP